MLFVVFRDPSEQRTLRKRIATFRAVVSVCNRRSWRARLLVISVATCSLPSGAAEEQSRPVLAVFP